MAHLSRKQRLWARLISSPDPAPVPSGADATWPHRFEQLARYNAEHARGIVHTPGWDARMAGVQRDFDACRRDGTLPLPDWEYDFIAEQDRS